ncbi:uncharacterized protein F5Z01DRAFT_194163 [Emericellopsis atlantica]|uniref:Integral membrane protein n=1 Tax=Emericellopsis atlantica TaxID=2614577 RepID=A0A9P7ZV35_9HYPO|nr:uncharacterized protein F5Z01DRAFT_194163 [Emericellopsis atlantica]KAG9258351.1 integral membrane protein [Emericellopsis atlantica]
MGWVMNASAEVDAQSEYPKIIAITVLFSVVSAAGVIWRLFIRRKSRGLAHDDYMAALSMVFAFAYSALCIAQTRYGLGLPLAARPQENLITYTKLNFAGRPIYQLGVSFFKMALLISYLRLLQGTSQFAYRLVVYTTIALVFLAHLGCAFSLIFACTPVAKSWQPLMDGTCLPPGPSFTAYAVVTIVSDIVVAVLPVPMLVGLNIQMAKKVGLIGIFILGLFTTMCSVFRYLQINRIQFGDGNSTMLILWGVIEFNVGNLVSSLPFLAPVFIRKAKDYRSRPSAGSSDGYGRKSRRPRTGEAYKLSERSTGTSKSVFTSTTCDGKTMTASQENILPQPGAIMKSVTYTVKVDDGGHDEFGARQ